MERKKKKITRKNIIIGIIFLIIILGMLGYIYVTYINKETPSKKQKKEPEVEEKKLTIVDEDSNQRPIAVMIDNNIGNGRHAGLQES